MALRHGFTRLWIVASALWFTLWLLANDTLVKAYEFSSSSYLAVNIKPEDLRLVSYDSGTATVSYQDTSNSWTGSDWYIDGPRVLEIETSGLTPGDGAEWDRLIMAAALKFSQDSAKSNAEVRLLRHRVLVDLVVAIAPPALVYVLGLLIAWIGRGFRKKV